MINPVTLVTPVCNRGDLTESFLSQHWNRYQNENLVFWTIIDNGSTDHTRSVLDRWQQLMGYRLNVMRSHDNKGFSWACNRGAEGILRGWLIFVNNDVQLRGDYVSRITSALEEDSHQLVGAQLLEHPTGWNTFGGETVSYLAGWCLGLKTSVFRELGGFDERFSPADYEDMDLSYKAQERGYALLGLELPIHHISEQTAITVLPNRRQITERNRKLFAEKWGLPCD